MSNSDYREQLIAVGKELYNRGLQTTRSGNVSVRDGEQFLITRTGSNLGQLLESDLVSVDIPAYVPISADASCESLVHRAIYNATDALAIVHAHPIHAIALAEIVNNSGILPVHNEGLAGLKRIPVVDTTVLGQDSGEEPSAIAASLAKYCSVVVRNHGAFTSASSLSQALYKMLLLEDSCRIVFLVQSVKKGQEPRPLTSPTTNRTTAKWRRSR